MGALAGRFAVNRCIRFRVAVGEYDPYVAGGASSAAGLVGAASTRLGALVAELREVGASCGLASAHEAAHVANAREISAVALAQPKAPSALVGAKLSVERQAAVDAIAAAKCDAARHVMYLLVFLNVYIHMYVYVYIVPVARGRTPARFISMMHVHALCARGPLRQALAMAKSK